MSEQYSITCFSGRHVHVLDREKMVKLFGRDKVHRIDENPVRNRVFAPSCMECDEEEEHQMTERDIHDLNLEMSDHDGYNV